MKILTIDPGCTESAYVIIDDDLKPVDFEIIDNMLLREKLITVKDIDFYAIEMIKGYGMNVGQEIFDTCVYIGRLLEILKGNVTLISRSEVKLNLTGSMRAKDKDISDALCSRFAYGQKNKGKGDKKNPGYFYGFADDIWSAYAIAVTYYDLYIKGGEKA